VGGGARLTLVVLLQTEELDSLQKKTGKVIEGMMEKRKRKNGDRVAERGVGVGGGGGFF